MLEQGFAIAKTNWKHNLLPHFLVGALLVAAAPLVMGVRNLEEAQVARAVELYLCLLGIVLFVPLFMPDANADIRDLTASKRIPITAVRLIRLAESFLAMALLLSVFLGGLKYFNCQFAFGKMFYAAFADCVALGGLGILFYGISGQAVLAYMAPIVYYVVSLGSGEKYLKVFWLMSLLKTGKSVSAEDKIWLLTAGLIMMLAALVIRWKRRT